MVSRRANARSAEVSMLSPVDPSYPSALEGVVKSAPLYLLGNIDLLGKRAIGICGSRNASDSALTWAHRFGYEAAKCGLVVVSGYARGVDREAHRGALEAGGSTIAVLPEGIRRFRLIPELRNVVDLEKNFLVISMFEPDDRWQVWRAMARNRVIVGLSAGLFVIEAGETGGTIEAAREAIRQRKRLWAIAYADDSIGRKGNRLLIGESAIPLKGTADFRQALDQAMHDPPPDVRQLVMSLVEDAERPEPSEERE